MSHVKQPDTTVREELLMAEANPPPRQLRHDTGPQGGLPCSRCGLVYSSRTAYVPCFVEGDTLATWLARNNEVLTMTGHPLAQKASR